MRQSQVLWVMVLLAAADMTLQRPSSQSHDRASEFYLLQKPASANFQIPSEIQHTLGSRSSQDFRHMFFNSGNHFPNRSPGRNSLSSNPHVPSGIESLSSGAEDWNLEKIPVVQNPASLLPAVSYKENFNFQKPFHRIPGSSIKFGNTIPEAVQRVPQSEGDIPASIAPLLQSEDNLPAAIAPLPQPEGNLPAAIAPLPQPESNLPAAIAPLPQTENNLPAATAPLPQPESNLPAAIAPLPQSEDNLPAAIAPLSQSEDNLPAAIAPLPQSEDNLPAAIAPLPQSADNLPAAIAPLPQSEDNLPAAIAPLPQSEDNLPAAIAPLPQSEDNLPAAIAPLPAAIAPLPQPEGNLPAAIAPLPQLDGDLSPSHLPLPHSEGPAPPENQPLSQSENNSNTVSGSSAEVKLPQDDLQMSSEISSNSSPPNSQNSDSQNGDTASDADDSVEVAEDGTQSQSASDDDIANILSGQTNQGFLIKRVTNHIALEPSSPEDTNEQLAISLNNILPSNNYLYATDDSPFYIHQFMDEMKYITRDDGVESSPSEETETAKEEENAVTSLDNLTDPAIEETESSTQETSIIASLPTVDETLSEENNNTESKSNPEYEEVIKKLETDENVLNAKYKFLAAWNGEVARQGVYMLRIANVYPETGFVYMPDVEYYTRSLQASPQVTVATADLMKAWRDAKDKYSLDGVFLNSTSSSTDEDTEKSSQGEATAIETDATPASGTSTSHFGSLRFEFPQVSGNQKYPYQPYILPNNQAFLHQPYLSYINSIFPYLTFLQRGNFPQISQPFIQAPSPAFFQGITRPADIENAIPVGNNEIPGRVPDQWDVKDLTRPNEEPEVSPPVAAHHRPATTQVEGV